MFSQDNTHPCHTPLPTDNEIKSVYDSSIPFRFTMYIPTGLDIDQLPEPELTVNLLHCWHTPTSPYTELPIHLPTISSDLSENLDVILPNIPLPTSSNISSFTSSEECHRTTHTPEVIILSDSDSFSPAKEPIFQLNNIYSSREYALVKDFSNPSAGPSNVNTIIDLEIDSDSSNQDDYDSLGHYSYHPDPISPDIESITDTQTISSTSGYEIPTQDVLRNDSESFVHIVRYCIACDVQHTRGSTPSCKNKICDHSQPVLPHSCPIHNRCMFQNRNQ